MPEPGDYDHLNVPDLKDLAEDAGLEGYSQLNREPLIEHLIDNDVPAPVPEDEDADLEPVPEDEGDEEEPEGEEEDDEEVVHDTPTGDVYEGEESDEGTQDQDEAPEDDGDTEEEPEEEAGDEGDEEPDEASEGEEEGAEEPPEDEGDAEEPERQQVRVHAGHPSSYEFLDEHLDHEVQDYKRYQVEVTQDELDDLLEDPGQPFVTPLAS